MSYITTKLQPIKSYPTYQFYAKADSKSLGINDVFLICILETFKWLRSRLKDFDDIPSEIMVPDPENYADFSDENLVSFSYSNGLNIEVIYIESKSVWSFRLSETDMGANANSDYERPPVQGRTFDTEISFAKQERFVEIGIRTICSEPSNTTANCEVFRPTVVKALAENSNIRLRHSGFIINKTPLVIKTKTDVEKFSAIFDDETLSLPIVLVCDSESKVETPKIEEFKVIKPSYNLGQIFSLPQSEDVSIDTSSINFSLKKNVPVVDKKKSESKPNFKVAQSNAETVKTKLPVFDYEKLAVKLVGFAIVAFVDEKHLKSISDKTRICLKHGDIAVIRQKQELEHYTYNDYCDKMDRFFSNLRNLVIEIPKRKQYYFGDVLFYSDAKITDYRSKRLHTTSLEEQCDIFRMENNELKEQLKDLSQRQTDMQQTADFNRLLQKKNSILQKELEKKDSTLIELTEQKIKYETAYKASSILVSFYKAQVEIASAFPTRKDDVCTWIEDNFYEYIVVTSRAKAEMKKFSGALNIATLCDGIVYLNAYAKFRNHIIDENELRLYRERNNWEVQGCGKEALKMRKSDYTTSYNDIQYTLDLHIKHGIKSEELIRVYFCWDEKLRKIVIGSMPAHLSTVRNNG